MPPWASPGVLNRVAEAVAAMMTSVARAVASLVEGAAAEVEAASVEAARRWHLALYRRNHRRLEDCDQSPSHDPSHGRCVLLEVDHRARLFVFARETKHRGQQQSPASSCPC